MYIHIHTFIKYICIYIYIKYTHVNTQVYVCAYT